MTPELARRNIRLLMLFNFFEDFLPYSVFAILIFAEIGGSFTAGAAAFSVTMLTKVIFEVPTGIVSDLVGRKGTMVLGAAFSAAGMVCYVFAQDAGLLFIGSALGGISTAFYSGNNEAFLYDTLTEAGREDEYRDVSGRTSSMFQAAGAVSAVTGGLMAATLGYRAVLIATVFPQIACVFVALLMTNPRRHVTDQKPFAHLRESAALIWHNPRLLALTVGNVTRFAFGEVGFQMRSAFVERLWPLWAIGLMRAASNVLAAFSFYFAGRIIRRFGERRILIGGIVFTNAIDVVWITFAGVLSPLVMGLNSVFFGAITVSSGSLIQREFSAQHRATMGSVGSLAGSFLFAVVSVGFGAITDRISADAALMFAVIGAMTSAYWYRKALEVVVN
ncbi:MAG: MFS transporter [Chloroflexi bacterium]|nr:MFS transporter [Chloroflexota bacterium]